MSRCRRAPKQPAAASTSETWSWAYLDVSIPAALPSAAFAQLGPQTRIRHRAHDLSGAGQVWTTLKRGSLAGFGGWSHAPCEAWNRAHLRRRCPRLSRRHCHPSTKGGTNGHMVSVGSSAHPSLLMPTDPVVSDVQLATAHRIARAVQLVALQPQPRGDPAAHRRPLRPPHWSTAAQRRRRTRPTRRLAGVRHRPTRHSHQAPYLGYTAAGLDPARAAGQTAHRAGLPALTAAAHVIQAHALAKANDE